MANQKLNSLENQQNRLKELCSIGVALSAEKDINKLLEMIAGMARKFTNAEGSTVYILNEEKNVLEFSVVQNEKLNIYATGKDQKSDWPAVELFDDQGNENHNNASAHCALTGQPVNISDVYSEKGFDFSGTREFDTISKYRSQSMLLMPMRDNDDDVIGVLQLLNARPDASDEVCDFPDNEIDMVMGLASQAAVAVTNVRLINRMQKYTSIGVALSAEKDINKLLEMIASMAKSFTNAEGCTVYVCDDEKEKLEFAVVQNDILGIDRDSLAKGKWPSIPLRDEQGQENHSNVSAHCALTGTAINIPDVYNEEGYDFSGMRSFDESSNYRSKSMLLIPMRDHEDEVIGVLQLLNARKGISRHICPFPENEIQMVTGLASQAAVAVTNVRLIKDIETLLKSFVRSIAAAIDEKSPYTAGHILRVAQLTEFLTKSITESSEESVADINFTNEQMEEIHLAAWMHDVGKIATPEHVVDKATKLETIIDRVQLVKLRIEILKRDQEIARLKEQAGESIDSSKPVSTDDAELNSMYEFIEKINIGGEFMNDEDIDRVNSIGKLEFKMAGETVPLLNENELDCCSIRKGTLTGDERDIINRHVSVSITMLESLPFPKKWQRVPEYAGMHHEKIDGTGYPRGKKGDEITVPARIIAVADIFEALTAADRPYKTGKKLSEAMRIMGFMVKDNHLDERICNLLVEDGIVARYADLFLDDIQKDSFVWNGKEYSFES